MDVDGKVVVVTGAAGGIGFALAERFAAEGAQVVLSDLDPVATAARAQSIGGYGVAANVGVEADIARLTEAAIARFGPHAVSRATLARRTSSV